MKTKIIERLKSKFSGVNLSKERMDAIADKLATKITEEDQIDAKLDELNEVFPFADIAKQDDRVRSFESRKPEPSKASDPPKSADPPKAKEDEPPAWAKALLEKVEGLERSKVATTRKEQVAAKLKDADEKYRNRVMRDFDRMKIDSEDDFVAVLSDIESDFKEHVQAVANSGLGNDRPFGGISGPSKDKPSNEELDKYVDQM